MSHSLFNRKHYVVMAKLIADNNDDFEKLVDNLIIHFQNDNPRFSKKLFIQVIEEHIIMKKYWDSHWKKNMKILKINTRNLHEEHKIRHDDNNVI